MNISENAVIGGLLQDNARIDEVKALLQPADFSDPKNRLIINMIYCMKSAVDFVTVTDKFKNDSVIMSHLVQCINQCTSLDNLMSYVLNVKNESKKQKIIVSAQALLANPDLLDQHKQQLLELEIDTTNQYYSISDLYNTSLLNLDEKPNRGLLTGFREIDKALSGLQPGNLIVLAARPGMGKTLLALHIARHIGMINKFPTLFFELEMQKEELCHRLISFYSNMHFKKIRERNFANDDWQILMASQKYFQDTKLFIHDKANATLNDVRIQARHLKNREGLAALFVDHISLMGDCHENEVIRHGLISRGLKSIAKDFDIPVIAISQLNRKLEDRKCKRPILSDIRQSGEIEQDADVIMFLYNGAYYHDHDCPTGIAELEIAKHRNGECAQIKLRYDFSICEFRDY